MFGAVNCAHMYLQAGLSRSQDFHLENRTHLFASSKTSENTASFGIESQFCAFRWLLGLLLFAKSAVPVFVSVCLENSMDGMWELDAKGGFARQWSTRGPRLPDTKEGRRPWGIYNTHYVPTSLLTLPPN